MLEERNVCCGRTMPRTESSTPYDATVALVLSGFSDVVVAQRLRARGLDDESVSELPTDDTTLGPCTRCGTFVTVATHQLVLKKMYCVPCAARPDVNYPKIFRDAHWGKRDRWAWAFGMFSVLSLIGGVSAVIAGSAFIAVPALVAAVVYAQF